MKKSRRLIILPCVLLLGLLCCSCTKKDEQQKEDGFISDLTVKTCWQNKAAFTIEDEKAAAELIRQFVSQACPELINEADTYYLSQPYPFLNLDERKYDVFLFSGDRCIGILAFSEIGDKYEGSFAGPLAEEELPEITKWLIEENAFVLLTDGMRLWFVSEQESFPGNLKELEGPTVCWQEEYAPFKQALKLTKLDFSD